MTPATTPPEERDFQLTALDYGLAAATLPLTLFVLMFATSGMTTLLESPRKRRTLGVVLLGVEATAVTLIVWAVIH